MDETQGRFIDDLSRVLATWGVAPAAGRLYSYLLLCPEPVDLDTIVVALQMSKSGASVAARQLESYRMVRRSHVRGSRRVLYEQTATHERLYEAQSLLLNQLIDLYRVGAEVTAHEAIRQRLSELAEFYGELGVAMEAVVRRWRERSKA